MKKFVCEQNVAHFQKLLSETTDPSLQRTLQSLMSSAKREFAILNSTQSGAAVVFQSAFVPENDGPARQKMIFRTFLGCNLRSTFR